MPGTFLGKWAILYNTNNQYLTSDGQGIWAGAGAIGPSETFIIYCTGGGFMGIYETVFQVQANLKYVAIGNCVPNVYANPGMCGFAAKADFDQASNFAVM